MSAAGPTLTLRQWFGVVFGAIVPGLAVWLALLYPLVPKGVAGWAIAAGTGVVTTIWAMLSVAALSWLQGRKTHRFASNALGLVVALQLGVGIFALARYHQDLLIEHFSYFGR